MTGSLSISTFQVTREVVKTTRGVFAADYITIPWKFPLEPSRYRLADAFFHTYDYRWSRRRGWSPWSGVRDFGSKRWKGKKITITQPVLRTMVEISFEIPSISCHCLVISRNRNNERGFFVSSNLFTIIIDSRKGTGEGGEAWLSGFKTSDLFENYSVFSWFSTKTAGRMVVTRTAWKVKGRN